MIAFRDFLGDLHDSTAPSIRTSNLEDADPPNVREGPLNEYTLLVKVISRVYGRLPPIRTPQSARLHLLR